MTDRLALPRRYREQLEALLCEHVPGVEVWAYGSRVNGDSHDGSDLDLALRGPALEPLDGGFYDLLEAIEKSNIPILVQAHDWAMLPESFHREIERDYVVVQEGADQRTASEWRKVALGEIAQVRSGYAFKSADWTSMGIPVVKIANVKVGNLTMEGCASVPPAVASQAGRFNLQEGDILIALTGYIGDVALVKSHDLPAVLNQRVGLFSVLDESRLDNSFLFQLLRNPDMRESIQGLGYGSAQPNVSPTLIHNLTLSLPSLPEQRGIAHVLGTLDDKIELNRRMNETLEAMARALFTSWFVDFEPVRAKMEGHWRRGESLPGVPAEHYDLFPDRLVDSELGEVPEGWEVKALDCIATFLNGLALQKYPPVAGATLPVIKIVQLRAGNTVGADLASSNLPADYVVHDGDVLFSWSGSLIVDTWTGGDGALNQHLFKVTSTGLSPVAVLSLDTEIPAVIPGDCCRQGNDHGDTSSAIT